MPSVLFAFSAFSFKANISAFSACFAFTLFVVSILCCRLVERTTTFLASSTLLSNISGVGSSFEEDSLLLLAPPFLLLCLDNPFSNRSIALNCLLDSFKSIAVSDVDAFLDLGLVFG